ncbi:hypothetical protein [Georgenia sp. AZ-5]
MCGRYANFWRDSDLIDAFHVEDVRDLELEPSWNVPAAERAHRCSSG